MASAERPQLVGVLVGVGASSASVLILEVALTRVFAVAQFYHFAFLAVSLALLGYGASGSVLAVWPRLGRGGARRWTALAAAQGLSTVGAYIGTNRIPFDSFSLAWDRTQIAWLVAYLLALAVPFFFGGLVIGTLLSGWDQHVAVDVRRIYAASLAGSGLGALIAIVAFGQLGGEGVVLLAAFVALGAALAFALTLRPRPPRLVAPVVAATLVVGAATLSPPAFLDLELSPYKDLTAALRYPGAEVASTAWSASGRVDTVRSDGIRSLPGLSFTYPGAPPPQDGVTIDGDDLSPIPRVAAEDAEFASHLLGSLAFSLRPGGEMLVLEPRGGLDVLIALHEGATRVTAVESNADIVDAARSAVPNPYDDVRVEVVIDEPRSYVERTDRRFDVIDVALTTGYRPVSSGAYSLAEDYLLTSAAFDRYLDRLAPDGVLTAMRWLQTPPSEETRLLALAIDAARRAGADPASAVVALRGYATALVLVKPAGFDEGELEQIRAFAEDRRFDIVVGAGIDGDDANRYNRLPDDPYHPLASALVATSEPHSVYETAEFDIAPPSDDHPFFGHFFRWSQTGDVVDSIGRTWQPFGGAGFFVLVVLLGFAVVGAAVLILGPLALTRNRASSATTATKTWTVGYFGLLGIAFLFVEIPLAQRYILLIGRPTTALATVLFAVLLASGAGSMLSARIPWRPAAGALSATALLMAFGVGPLTNLILPAPEVVRILLGSLLLAPLGFLMGVMFPSGLARLQQLDPSLVPWAWGINGVSSVISAVASALLALSFGFRAVIVIGALCYGATALLARPAT